MPAAVATRNAETYLARLGVKPTELNKIKTLPLAQLVDAVQLADGGGFAAPVVDGASLPHDVFSPEATALSSKIPLLIGSTETEVTWSVGTDYTPPADIEVLRARVQKSLRTDAAHAGTIVDAVRAGRPRAHSARSRIDNRNRRIRLPNRRRPGGGEKSRSRRRGGLHVNVSTSTRRRAADPRAMHCMDIPSAFDTIDESQSIVGSGADRRGLADRMSGRRNPSAGCFASTSVPARWQELGDARGLASVINSGRLVACATGQYTCRYGEVSAPLVITDRRQRFPRARSC